MKKDLELKIFASVFNHPRQKMNGDLLCELYMLSKLRLTVYVSEYIYLGINSCIQLIVDVCKSFFPGVKVYSSQPGHGMI
ncbi:MAG: hypothetical protein QM763_15125 [Agriterribacter sp.]